MDKTTDYVRVLKICLWKLPHRHAQRCTLLISQTALNTIKLTVKMNQEFQISICGQTEKEQK
jgi:hypothetical protein